MTALGVPSTSGSQHPSSPNQGLRTVRSAGALRTPNASSEPGYTAHNGASTSRRNYDISLSPPDLSFSKTSLQSHSDPEASDADFLARQAGSSNSAYAGDSWRSSNSRMGGRSGMGKNRIRLDSVFGTSLPGFPYLNSAAAATSAGIPSDLRQQASWNWSDRSQSRASNMKSVRDSAATTSSNGGEADTSCSGGSNSSDDVDLDLSFDMEALKARQRSQQAARAKSEQRHREKSRAAHVGIDMTDSRSQGDAYEDSDEYRRYRLQGRKRMSRSAIELRAEDPQVQHYQPSEALTSSGHAVTAPALHPNHAQQPASSSRMWARRGAPSPVGDLQIPMDSDEMAPPAPQELGWSFATTPPLSPAELVEFAQSQQPNPSSFLSHSPNHSDPTSSMRSRLRTRRPSLMLLLDKAMRNSPASSPSATTATWNSPTPTQSDMPGSGPGTFATSSPDTNQWDSPQTQDEAPTPQSVEVKRFSEYSMKRSGKPESPHEAIPLAMEAEEDLTVKVQEKQAASAQPGNTRRSSSILRFPFTGLFSSLRPASPATTIVPTAAMAEAEPSSSPTQIRANSPASDETHGESAGSSQSHTTPPRIATTRQSAVISQSMLRPGPNTGRGRLTGLGFHLPGQQNRFSSLPVISFSTATDEGHGSSSGQGHGSSDAGHSVGRRGSNENVHDITPIQPRSAPATAVQFDIPAMPPAAARRYSAEMLSSSGPPHSAPASQSHLNIPVQREASVDASASRQSKTMPALRRRMPARLDLDLRGRLDQVKPSQLLFIAAFLVGPWCFAVGGWALRSTDGEFRSTKGARCRCPAKEEECVCKAELYRQARVAGGNPETVAQNQAAGRAVTLVQTKKTDRFVLANRVAALLSGVIGLVCSITALIVVSRTW